MLTYVHIYTVALQLCSVLLLDGVLTFSHGSSVTSR